MLRRVFVVSLVLAWIVGCDSAESGSQGTSGNAGSGSSSGAGGTGGTTGGTGGATGGSGGTAGTGTGGTTGGSAGSSGGTTGGSAGSGGTTGGTAGTTGGSAGTGAGGSAGDAGSSGSSGSGAAGGGGSAGTSSGDPCDSALFCDDFESYTSGQAPNGMWSARTNAGGAVAIDTAQKVSGNQSVKFTTMGSDSSRQAMIRLMDPSVFPVTGNAYYGRMMFRLESAPTTAVHWTIITGGGVVPNETYHALYRYGGQHPIMQNGMPGSQLMANYETPDWYNDKQTPGSDCWKHASGEILPTGDFVCVEWQFDGPSNAMNLWLSGRAIPGASVTGSGEGCVNAAADFEWTAPTFETLDLGWEAYQTDGTRTAWIDDVVISTTRVGCP
jgi:hypothetical protein